MIPRLAFLLIAAFWVTMNILLWRAEYGSQNGGDPVPVDFVWRRILTAPDVSSLTVYQNGKKAGFCEFSTGVEQEMAKLDENAPPPANVIARAGYQIRLDGNVSLGNFTNRLRFDGRLQLFSLHEWRELSLKVDSPVAAAAVHSIATNQTVALEITIDGTTDLHVFSFAELENPNTLLRAFSGDLDGVWPGDFELPGFPQSSAALVQSIHWEARRERMMIGREPVSVYRLETEVLQNKIVIYVSTLGDILRVELPGGITATLDEWNQS